MSQVTVNFRMDAGLKHDMEAVCADLGMNMTTAFTIYAKKLTRERRVPFEVSVDPFYSASNMAHLRRGMEQMARGEGVEHELLEDDE